jgi:hypothetical protein
MTKRENQHPPVLKYVDINESGNFDTWNPAHIKELKEGNFSTDLGRSVLFENEYLRVWEIVLLPKERLPFRRVQADYCWVAGSEGMMISRFSNGKIVLMHIEKGDSEFLRLQEDHVIYDLENIGDDILFFQLTEFKGEYRLAKSRNEVIVNRNSNP